MLNSLVGFQLWTEPWGNVLLHHGSTLVGRGESQPGYDAPLVPGGSDDVDNVRRSRCSSTLSLSLWLWSFHQSVILFFCWEHPCKLCFALKLPPTTASCTNGRGRAKLLFPSLGLTVSKNIHHILFLSHFLQESSGHIVSDAQAFY